MHEALLQAQDAETNSAPTLDAQGLSSIIVALKFKQQNNQQNSDELHTRLLEALQSPGIKALLRAVEEAARAQGVGAEECLTGIVKSLQEVDQLWSQILMKEGLARLSTQFH